MLTVCWFSSFTAQAQTFTSFRFTAASLGWDADEEDFEGVIDDGNLTITFTTQRWIDNIEQLTAVFEVENMEGCDIKVGDDLQESGVTENDFQQDVVYTLCGNVHYTVHFASPQATGIPIIKIETQNGVEVNSKDNWTNMTSFTLIDPNDGNNDISLGAYGSQYHRIRGRGNTTWVYPKKPYRIRFREDISLFGEVARENWVLLADYLDPTFMTTAIAFELGSNVFPMPFTCTYQPVNVYYNGRYDGLYTLTQHRQADPNGTTGAPGRVGIDEDNGGWFIEIDSYWDEDPKFMTDNYELPVMIKSPEYEPEPTESDNPFYDFIKTDLNELCDVMASATFPENGYRDLIDMNSFVDFLMINEIVANHELRFPKSTFAYKPDQNGKICMGPLWDFDWAYGYAGGVQHDYFTRYTNRLERHVFFMRLFEDPTFVAMYKERWNDKYNILVAMVDFIEDFGEKVRPAALEDAERWMFPGGYRSEYDGDHARQTAAMKTWWTNRVTWLNTELNKVESVPGRKNFGSVTKEDDYSGIPSQLFTLVSYGTMEDLTVSLKNGSSSAFEMITSSNIMATATDNGSYMASWSVKLKDGLQLGAYSDELIFTGKNRGETFTVTVPLSFEITKFTQEPLLLAEVEDKVFGDENFFLTATGGSGNGDITYAVISGNATVDVNTGEVEITGAGAIVIVATKAEDDDYQQEQSKQLTVQVAKANPDYTVPDDITATYGNILADIELPANWTWEDETLLVGDVGEQTFYATYTPEDTDNYAVVDSIEITVTVGEPTGIPESLNPNMLRAWMRSGLLHVSGIAPGETLSIFSVTGTLIYHRTATSDEIDIPLNVRGIYFVRSGKHTVKVINYK